MDRGEAEKDALGEATNIDPLDIVSILLAGAITWIGLDTFRIDYMKGGLHQVRPLLICGTVFALGFVISVVFHALQVLVGGAS